MRDPPPDSSRSGAVSLPAIAAPKTGGSFSGLVGEFETVPINGSATLSVVLPISTNPQGAGPGLRLNYDTGRGNGPWGVGWSPGLPSIRRVTRKGVPRYHHGAAALYEMTGIDDLVPFLADNAGEFAPVVETRLEAGRVVIAERYRPRVESGFSLIERLRDTITSEVYWKTVSRQNVETVFGRSDGARIVDPTDTGRVFAWLIEEETHPNGSLVHYRYKAEDQSGIDPGHSGEAARLSRGISFAQRYLKRVLYGNRVENVADRWKFELVFDYGDHDLEAPTPDEDRPWPVRADAFSSYRSGFEIRTYRLCRRFLMFHHFPDTLAEAPYLVRSTALEYDAAADMAKLVRVQQFGHLRLSDEPLTYHTRSLPPSEFTYSRARIDDRPRFVAGIGIGAARERRIHRWLDVDGEGIYGVLDEAPDLWHYHSPVASGAGALFADSNAPPAVIAGGAPAALSVGTMVRERPNLAERASTFLDLSGDGHLDAVAFTGAVPGLYERTVSRSWSARRAFKSLPNIDWGNDMVRLVDLTGDGLSDLVVMGARGMAWHRARGEDGFGPAMPITFVGDAPAPWSTRRDPRRHMAFADMNGDGLPDLVSVRAGRVDYWPSLGHGRFAAPVPLPLSMPIEDASAFDAGRVRLADIDGSGTNDIVYLGRRRIALFFNEAGNNLTGPRYLDGLPSVDNASDVEVRDVLGKGTAAIVWTSRRHGDQASGLRIIDLAADGKPHLLTQLSNGIGGETRITYQPSTYYYLRDKSLGHVWRSPPPSPLHVVERYEQHDHVTGTNYASVFRYHDGCYDRRERESCGFAHVERWDSNRLADSDGPGAGFTTPPSHTKLWFHTGVADAGDALGMPEPDAFYPVFATSSGSDRGDAPRPLLPITIAAAERRHALRALRGTLLRREVYGRDGAPEAAHPYVIEAQAHALRALQPGLNGHPPVFLPMPHESFTFRLDRVPDDPHVSQEITLAVDEFGTVTRTATVHYPRREPEIPEQARLQCLYSQSAVINTEDSGRWIGVTAEARSYEVRGFNWSWQDQPEWLQAADFAAVTADPDDFLPFEAEAQPGLSKRLLTWSRTYFRTDTSAGAVDATGSGAGRLPLGQIASRGLEYEVYTVVMSDALAELGESPGSQEALATLGYHREPDTPGLIWAPSGRAAFGAFFQPVAMRDPFGAFSSIEYDDAGLPVAAIDPLGNRTVAVNDHRVLEPRVVTDANQSVTELAFDTLGFPVGSARRGRNGEGDTLDGFEADPPDPLEVGSDGLGAPRDLLASATSRSLHDFGRYLRSRGATGAGEPILSVSIVRERHVSDEAERGEGPVRQAIAYFDGLGRPAATKTEAEPDSDEDDRARWLSSGRVVRDNKGNPVRRFQPFFSRSALYDPEEAALEIGVSDHLTYDAIGRVVRVDYPDGTFEQTAYAPWSQLVHDRTDTVLDSAWYHVRGAPDPDGSEPVGAEARAAFLSARNAVTPVARHLDPLGRAVVGVAMLADGTLVHTRTELDISGNRLSIADDRGIIAERTIYDMAGRVLTVTGADNGSRRAFHDVAGRLCRQSDGLGRRRRLAYDAAGRPTSVFLTDIDHEEHLIEVTLYGEGHPEALERQLNGRVFRHYDAVGATTNERYDFKGAVVEASQRLARTYRDRVTWDGLQAEAGIAVNESAAEQELEPRRFETRTTYNALGRIVTHETPDGSVIRPEYDASTLLARLDVTLAGHESTTRFVETITRDALGQRQLITYGNGVTTRYTRDPLTFRLTHMETRRAVPAAMLQDIGYTYDAGGRVVEIVDRAQQVVFAANQQIEPRRRYTYDALGRLTSAEGREHPGHQQNQTGAERPPAMPLPHPNDPSALRTYIERYAYDSVGNIERVDHTGAAGNWARRYSYADDSNRLLATSRTDDLDGMFSDALSHDVHGNVTGLAHLTRMDWDHADRLRATARTVVANGSVPETTYYNYSAAGVRVRKVTDRGARADVEPVRRSERIYLGPVEIYREYATDGETVTLERWSLHVMDDESRIALVETRTVGDGAEAPRTVRFQLGDHLRSAAMEVDETGAVITYEEFHPFGTTALRAGRSAAETSLKRYLFSGAELDTESGLQLLGARYYAPWLGRWTACDPMGLADGLATYAYAGNDPVALRDPGGTAKETFQAGQTISKSQFEAVVEGDAAIAENTIALQLPGGGGEHLVTPTAAVAYSPEVAGDESHIGVLFQRNQRGLHWRKEYAMAAQKVMAKSQNEWAAGRILASKKMIAATVIVGGAGAVGVLTGGWVFAGVAKAGGGTFLATTFSMGADGVVSGALQSGGLSLLEGASFGEAAVAAGEGGLWGGGTGLAFGGGLGLFGRLAPRLLRSGRAPASTAPSGASATPSSAKPAGPADGGVGGSPASNAPSGGPFISDAGQLVSVADDWPQIYVYRGQPKPYVGQTWVELLVRQRQHELKRGIPFPLESVGRASPAGKWTSVTEETVMRAHGTPTTKRNPNGTLLNRRVEMSESNFQLHGGYSTTTDPTNPMLNAMPIPHLHL